MTKIGSNIVSQTVQRQLGKTVADLSRSSERLASGQRLNSGSDDAAGLSIAAALKTSGRVYSQGIRNLSDGISAISIAEGALGELTEVITRIEELSAQAINGTFSNTQRESLQQEVTALQAEWNRIVSSTSFNGARLLTGEATRTVLQGGRGTEGALAVSFGEEAFASGFDNYAGQTTRVNLSAAGVEATNYSYNYTPSISANGRYVAFHSTSSNLVPGDTNFLGDIFVKDTDTGAITRASTTSAGVQGNGYSRNASLSGDGNYVAFQSTATNLAGSDTNGASDIFLKNLITGTMTRISESTAGVLSNATSSGASISSDGNFVAFSSTGTNLVSGDANGVQDIFAKNVFSGELTRVSTSSAGVEGNGVSNYASLSADGRYVAFQSSASNLIAGDTNGTSDIFVKDLQTGIVTRVSTSADGSGATASSGAPRISADGKHVAFRSNAALVADDTNGSADIYVKDLTSGSITRANTSSSGAQTGGFIDLGGISADGRFVVFQSSANDLVSDDTNGSFDVFVKDLFLGTTTRASVSTAGVEGNGSATRGTISADGTRVAFDASSSNLVNNDTNNRYDIFLRDLRKAGVQQLAGMVVSNAASAKITFELAKSNREDLQLYRAGLGASTARIQAFSNALESARLSYEGAYSRIADADVAEESSKYLTLSIKQQISAALLGQANQLPGLAIDLLKNA